MSTRYRYEYKFDCSLFLRSKRMTYECHYASNLFLRSCRTILFKMFATTFTVTMTKSLKSLYGIHDDMDGNILLVPVAE